MNGSHQVLNNNHQQPQHRVNVVAVFICSECARGCGLSIYLRSSRSNFWLRFKQSRHSGDEARFSDFLLAAYNNN